VGTPSRFAALWKPWPRCSSPRPGSRWRWLLFQSEPLDRPAAGTNGKIAFATGVDGRWQIVIVNGNGTAITPLTDLPTNQSHPAWSPDGTRIAFDAQSGGGETQIHVMDADGSNVQVLAEGPGWNYLPAWSPDGARIAFVSNRDGNDEIYVMDADGSAQTRLTTDPDEDLSPTWSPDGSRIAFQSNRDGFNRIYLMNADGSSVTSLTDSEGFDPAWSADGAWIAFASTTDGNPEIYVMNTEGSEATRLTHDPSHDWNPTWSPDGSKIAFQSDRDGDVGVYVMSSDGTDVRRLLETGSRACCPSWQPIPTGQVSPAPSDTSSTTPTPSVSESVPVEPSVTARIPAGAFLRGVAVGEGAVWATVDNANGGPDDHVLVRIDPETNEIVDSLPLPEAGDLTVGEGSVWVLSRLASEGTVLRIDPATSEIAAMIPVGDQLSNIAVGEGAVWLTEGSDANPPSGEVVRIDPTTNQIAARIPVSGGWPRDLVIGEGSVWVYGHSRLAEHGWEASSLWRIDPMTNEPFVVVDQEAFLGDGAALPDNVAIGDGHVWAAAADEEGRGLRIDPATGEVARFEVEGGFAWPFLVEAHRVWFGRDEIRLLDTETLEVVEVVDAEIEGIDAAFDPKTASLWVANYDGTITRIDLG
jgi:Tol biopolymer transport system component